MFRICFALLLVMTGCAKTKALTEKTKEITEKTAKTASDLGEGAVNKAADLLVGTPTPTATPEPTPTPFFAGSILEIFPNLEKWKPPEYPNPVEPVAFRVLTATEPAARRGPPKLSPDARYVAYDEGEGDERRLIIRQVTGDLVRSVRLPQGDGAQRRSPFCWSPTSSAIVFTRQIATGGSGLFVVDLAGAERLLVTQPVVDGEVDWSPTGDRIGYVRVEDPRAIWFIGPEGQEARRAIQVLAPVQNLAFSPDGGRLAFAAGNGERDLYVAQDLSESAPTVLRLTRWYFDDVNPGWSPDGNTLAFYSTYNAAGAPSIWSLFVIRADGRDPASGQALAGRMVFSNVEADVTTRPAWLPEQGFPLCVREAERGYLTLWAINPANRDAWRVDPDTRVNRNVMCTRGGLCAFSARKEWAEHIVIGLVYQPDRPLRSSSWP